MNSFISSSCEHSYQVRYVDDLLCCRFWLCGCGEEVAMSSCSNFLCVFLCSAPSQNCSKLCPTSGGLYSSYFAAMSSYLRRPVLLVLRGDEHAYLRRPVLLVLRRDEHAGSSHQLQPLLGDFRVQLQIPVDQVNAEIPVDQVNVVNDNGSP